MTTPAVWEHIRAGRPPTTRRVGAVVAAQSLVLGEAGVEAERTALADEVLGAGPLEPLLRHPGVTDVLVNGVDGVWVDVGDGLRRAEIDLGGPDQVRRLAVRLAGLAHRRLDEAAPYVDGLLPGGVRLHAVLPPLVEGAAHISLRVPRRTATSLADLTALGSMPKEWAAVLRALVARRVSYVVSGGTGAGKTTLLAALLAEVPADERMLIVEDVRELAVHHPHVVRLASRPANVEGQGAVDMVALVRQSLRMRPDRLVVGEVRGAEVREMLTALNTGHDGGCSTIHANAAEEVVARFEALGALAELSPAATRTQLGSAVQAVVHVRREAGRRFVDSIAVLHRTGDGALTVLPALSHGGHGGVPGAPTGAVEPGWSALQALLGERA